MWPSLHQWMKQQVAGRKTPPVRKRTQLRCEPLDERIVPAAGDLDLSFGTAGKVVTGFPHSNSLESAVGMAVQSDSKIVLVGSSFNRRNMDFALARYHPDGTVDTTFGTGGLVTSDFGNMDNYATGVVIQADGKIVVAGTIVIEVEDEGSSYIDYDFELARYNTDGSLDTTFGTNGHVSTNFGSLDDAGFGVAIQSDGKIVVTGETNGNVALARYNTNGSLDTSFDTDGLVSTDLGAGDGGRTIAIQSDDQIVVVGYGQGATNRDLAVLRYNATNGSLDTSFSSDGIAFADFGDIDFGAGVVIQPDGKIVAVGSSGGYSDNNVVTARFDTNGTLDSTFGVGGLVQTDLGANDYGRSVALYSDGRILVGGTTGPNDGSDNDFALIRYNSNGTLDTNFSGDGKLITNLSTGDGTGAVKVLANGRILVAGGSGAHPNLDFTLLRYTSTGTLDSNFSGDGIVTTEFVHNSPLDVTGGAQSIAIQPDGKIVVAGSTDGKFALVRYEADGTLDASFGVNGLVSTDIAGTVETGRAVLLQPDGKIILVGEAGVGGVFSSSGDFAVLRYNSDGSLDTDFGDEGIVITSITPGLDSARSVALQADGKIVVGGDAGGGSLIPSGDFAVVRYNTDGTLDSTFDTDGIVTTHVPVTVFGIETDLFSKSVGYSVVVQPNGKILLAGGSGFAFSSFTLLRYNANGSLDTTFDTDGIVTTFMNILSLEGVTIEDLGDSMDVATSMVLQSDGKIVVGGATLNENGTSLAVLRYNTNGSLDTSFSDDGRLQVPGIVNPNIVMFTGLGSVETTASIAVQPNGKILIGGHDLSGVGGSDFAVARFLSNGTPDTSFSGDGRLTTDFNNSEDIGYSLALQPDGKIIVAGGTLKDGSPEISVVRYKGDDVTPPDTEITGGPTNPTNDPNPTFTFTGSDDLPDGTGVASYEVSFDGAPFTLATSPFSPGPLATGPYTFAVRAIDNAGNVDPTPATYTFYVDLIEPDTSFVSVPATPTSDNTPTFNIQGSDLGSGVVRYEGSLNGSPFAEVPGIYTTAPLPDGEYTLLVRSVDAAGNVDSTPAAYTFLVDTTAPDTSIDTFPTDPTSDNTPTFTFSGDDGTGSGVASFEVSVDGGAFTTRTSPFTTNTLSDGNHTIQVRAIDNLGNVDPTPAAYTFLVDTTGPETTIEGGPGAATNNHTPTFTFSGDDGTGSGVASFEVSVDGGAFFTAASPFTTSTLAFGDHTFAVRARDSLGNVDPTPAVYNFIVQPILRFDMKANATTAAPTGWNRVLNTTTYDAATGFGWAATTGIKSGTGPSPAALPPGTSAGMYGDFHYGTGTVTFRMFVGAFRTATVRVYSYAPTLLTAGMKVTAENGTTASSPVGGGMVTVTGNAGADGILNITITKPAGAAFWAVNGLEVIPTT